MRSVGVIGLDLIGGSMAKAFSEKTDASVYGYDLSADVVLAAQKEGVIDGDLSEHYGEVDMLIVALYPDLVVSSVMEAAPKLKKGCIVVDCTGVKGFVCDKLSGPLKDMGLFFIGGHPMAGKEVAGYKNAGADLFIGASMILCKDENTDEAALKKASDVFLKLGFSMVKISTPKEHDMVIAYTSQLAHVVSSAYVKSSTLPVRYGYSAGSFKDLTRVAKLNEEMWADLFLANDEEILSQIVEIEGHLKEYEEAVRKKDRAALVELLRDGRIRKEEDENKEKSYRNS